MFLFPLYHQGLIGLNGPRGEIGEPGEKVLIHAVELLILLHAWHTMLHNMMYNMDFIKTDSSYGIFFWAIHQRVMIYMNCDFL